MSIVQNEVQHKHSQKQFREERISRFHAENSGEAEEEVPNRKRLDTH
jgi:hypothetical protein